MRLGLALGYWGRGPNPAHLELAREAEALGYASVWTAEAWGSDAFTPLTWIAANTSRIRLGTGIAQMAARTPTATAMHALTLDHLSGGRMMLGLGLSGPQVVEGWYGRPFPKSPLTATREYVDVIRQVLRREAPVELDGRFHSHPYSGPDATGLGKPLKPITHPLRSGLPVLLGAEGPRNIAQTTRIADGWLPLYWSPMRTDVYEASLTDLPDGFMIAPMARARVCDDVAEGLLPVKAMLGFYIGGWATRPVTSTPISWRGWGSRRRRGGSSNCSSKGASRRRCWRCRTPSRTRSRSSDRVNGSRSAWSCGARDRSPICW